MESRKRGTENVDTPDASCDASQISAMTNRDDLLSSSVAAAATAADGNEQAFAPCRVMIVKGCSAPSYEERKSAESATRSQPSCTNGTPASESCFVSSPVTATAMCYGHEDVTEKPGSPSKLPSAVCQEAPIKTAAAAATMMAEAGSSVSSPPAEAPEMTPAAAAALGPVLAKQLRELVSHKLSTLGDLDEAGRCALQALMKMDPKKSVPVSSSVPSVGTGSKQPRPPPGLAEVPKFNGQNATALTSILKRFRKCVRDGLRHQNVTPEQVNHALMRDCVLVLEGPAQVFYNNLMGAKIAWEAGTEEIRAPTEWRELCQAFHDEFLPLEGISRTCASILSLNQGPEESIATYATHQKGLHRHLFGLLERHGGITAWEALHVALFERGLHGDLLQAQRAEPACTSFHMCVDRALRNESILAAKLANRKPAAREGVASDQVHAGSLRSEPQAAGPAGAGSIGDPTSAVGRAVSKDCYEQLEQHRQMYEPTAKRPRRDSGSVSVKVEPTAESFRRSTENTPCTGMPPIDSFPNDNPPTERESENVSQSTYHFPRQHVQPPYHACRDGREGDQDQRPTTTTAVLEGLVPDACPARSQFSARNAGPLQQNSRKRRGGQREWGHDGQESRPARWPRKKPVFVGRPPCTIPECKCPRTHETSQCFRHPQHGPNNRKLHREYKEKLKQFARAGENRATGGTHDGDNDYNYKSD